MYHHHRQPLMDVATPFLMQHFAPPPHSSSPHQPAALHYSYFDRTADLSRRIPPQSSFVRSSAPRQMQHYAPQAVPSSYRSTFSMDSSSSGTGSYGHDGSPLGSPYEVHSTDPQPPAVSGGGQPFPADAYTHSWPQVAQQSPSQYPDHYSAGSYELPPADSSTSAADGNMMQGVKTEDSLEPYGSTAGGLYIASYADQLQNPASIPDHQGSLPSYSLNQYSQEVVTQQSLGYGYATADTQPHHSTGADVANMSSYLLGVQAHLQYPEEDTPRYVNPTQVSPMSPYAQLQELPQDQSCDPRFTLASGLHTVHGGASPSAFTDFDVDSVASGSPSMASVATSAPISVPAVGAERKRQRAVSFTSSSSDEELQAESGESEHDEDGEGEDEDYVQQSPRTRRRGLSASSASPSTSTGSFSMGRRLAAPVPVPNLTKKSRGRRVPTAQQVGTQGGPQKRMYMCKVAGCGKCFARGEHLKRHVRSIHTNDKPHKCPYPGCEKDFSRHDNLGQHMRVHKGYTMPKAGPL